MPIFAITGRECRAAACALASEWADVDTIVFRADVQSRDEYKKIHRDGGAIVHIFHDHNFICDYRNYYYVRYVMYSHTGAHLHTLRCLVRQMIESLDK